MPEKASSLVFYIFYNYIDIRLPPYHKVSLHWCTMLGLGFVVSTFG